MALRQSGLPFRRPPATGPLGRDPDRTPTGKPNTAFRTDTPDELTGETTKIGSREAAADFRGLRHGLRGRRCARTGGQVLRRRLRPGSAR